MAALPSEYVHPSENMNTSKLHMSIPGQDLGSDSQGNTSTTLRLGKGTTLQKEVEFKMYLFPQDLSLIVLQPECLHSFIPFWWKVLHRVCSTSLTIMVNVIHNIADTVKLFSSQVLLWIYSQVLSVMRRQSRGHEK